MRFFFESAEHACVSQCAAALRRETEPRTRTAISRVSFFRVWMTYWANVQNSQPTPTQIVLLMQIASAQGHGEEYRKAGR
jgi:hypothetical protein